MTQKAVFVEGMFTLHNLRSMGTAAVIEIMLASGIAAILLWQQLHPNTVISPPKRPPIVDFFPELPPVLSPTAPETQQPEVPQLSEVQPVREQFPSSTAQPIRQLPPPQASAGRSDLVDPVAEFTAGMLRAINTQKVYPKIALLKGETGEAVVSFDYSDGVVSNIHVDRSSGSRELDEAAVQAVQRAALPPKPALLMALNHFVFHLEFNLGN